MLAVLVLTAVEICVAVVFHAPLGNDGRLRILVGSVALPTPSAPLPRELEWILNGSWAWGLVADGGTVTQAQLEATWRSGLVPVCDLHASPTTRARQAAAHGRPDPNVSDVLATFVAAAASAGRPVTDVAWKAFEEEDSAGVAYPWDEMGAGMRLRFNTSANASALWNTHLAVAASEAAPWVAKGVELWGRVGFSMSTHSLARVAGVNVVLVERANDDIGDLLPAVAFARGAAAQFAPRRRENESGSAGSSSGGVRSWGIDMSQWWGPINGCVLQLPALYHRRHFYAAMAAGAGVVAFEGCGWLDGDGQPYPLASELASFGR